METWINISGFEGLYQVSNFGKIRRFSDGKILKQSIGTSGYYKIALWKNGRYRHFLVHRIIAIHFIQNPQNKKFVNHKDGNKLNNSIDNLEWMTRKENHSHAAKSGLMSHGTDRHNAKLNPSIAKQIRESSLSCSELSVIWGINERHVRKIKNNEIWRERKAS